MHESEFEVFTIAPHERILAALAHRLGDDLVRASTTKVVEGVCVVRCTTLAPSSESTLRLIATYPEEVPFQPTTCTLVTLAPSSPSAACSSVSSTDPADEPCDEPFLA